MRLKLSRNLIAYGRKIVFNHDTEIAGALKIRSKKDNNGVYVVNADYSSAGSLQDSDTESSLITFHTHQVKAYTNHGVVVGWPSSQDYISFLEMVAESQALYHLIFTVEGIYVLSVSSEWRKAVQNYKLDPKIIEMIRRVYHVDKKTSGVDVGSYVRYINGRKPYVFRVLLLKWDSAVDRIF